ncbi:MAG TPA: hypothetical protein VHZ55_21145 [Bryobacteraceae bacterium]|jgi:hypothetical protein|nr:hypothetical protein [Bryobacteraceae bacterium]
MAKLSAPPSKEILEAALLGLEAQRDKLDEQIAQVRAMIGGRPGRPSNASLNHGSAVRTVTKKRVLTPEARKRIAAAQKRRWAAFRKNQS